MVLEWIIAKALGVFLLLAGVFLVIFFPGVGAHQDTGGVNFGVTGIIIGVICFFLGIYLIIS